MTSSSIDRLRSFINDLSQSTDDVFLLARIDAIKQLVTTTDTMTADDTALMLSMVIDGANVTASPLKILKQWTINNTLIDSRAALLSLLCDIVTAYQLVSAMTQFQVLSLLSLAFYIVRAENASKLKMKAFDIIHHTIQLHHRHSDDRDSGGGSENDSGTLTPETMMKQLFDELNRSKSQLTATVRGQLIATLGKLSSLYPDTLRAQKYDARLYHYYFQSLKAEASSSKDMQRKLIEGVFQGLTFFLDEFSPALTVNDRKFLWQCLKSTLGLTMQQETRYDIVRASLSLLTKQSKIFQPLLTLESEVEAVLTLLLAAIKHNNYQVSRMALTAFDATIKTIVDGIVNTDTPTGAHASTDSERRRIFMLLLKLFVKKLEDRKSINEISLAIRAFGLLAKAIKSFMSESELNKFLFQLLHSSLGIFQAESIDEQEKAIHYLSSFIDSFALILLELSNINNTIVNVSLFALLSKFLHLFPSFTSSQRRLNLVSVTKLLVVLNECHSQCFAVLVKQLVETGLILTISKLPELNRTFAANTSNDNGSGVGYEREAYAEYCTLWHGLLGVTISQDAKHRDIDRSPNAWMRGLQSMTAGSVRQMRKLLFNELVGQLKSLIQRFDLSLTDTDASAETSNDSDRDSNKSLASHASVRSNDPSSLLSPTKPKDFTLYLNTVAFIQRLFMPPLSSSSSLSLDSESYTSYRQYTESLPSTLPVWNRRCLVSLSRWLLVWLVPLGSTVIELSQQHPLVSGFYKLASVLISIADYHHYFNTHARTGTRKRARVRVKVEEKEEEMKVDGDDNSDGDDDTDAKVKVEYDSDREDVIDPSSDSLSDSSADHRLYVADLFRHYLDTVITRLPSFAAELLFSTQKLLLTAPTAFCDVPLLVPVLVRTLRLGLTHRPAALLAIETLERWHTDDSTRQSLQPHLSEIIPEFNNFLTPINGQTNSGGDSLSVSGGKDSDSGSGADREWNAIIYRMLEFLGSLSSQHSAALLTSTDTHTSTNANTDNQQFLAWSLKQYVQYPLPFNRKLDIYFDSLLPRLCSLALNSNDRSIKVASGESLHAILIWMISSMARDPNRSSEVGAVSQSSFETLYAFLFPNLLRLSCSSEPIIHQLFEPLLNQLIHWFTNRHTVYGSEIRTLLNAITEGLIDETNNDLRQCSARAMHEFAKWSMRHSGQHAAVDAESEDQSQSATSQTRTAPNVSSMFRRLFSFARHPSQARRLGASLALNQIYKLFREFDELISHYGLEIIHCLLQSLQLVGHHTDAHTNSGSGSACSEETTMAIDHYAHILTETSQSKYKLLLTKSTRSGGTECQSLSTFVSWLWSNISAEEELYRRHCQSLFLQLSKLCLASIKTPRQWLLKWRERHSDGELFQLLELENDDERGINQPELSTNISTDTDIDSKVIERVIQWFDALAASYDAYTWLVHSQLIEPPELQSLLTSQHSHVLSSMRSLTDYVNNHSILSLSSSIAPSLLLTLRLKQSLVLLRLFRLSQLLLTYGQLSLQWLTQSYVALLWRCLFEPEQFGFRLTDSEEIGQIQSVIGSIAKRLYDGDNGTDRQQQSVIAKSLKSIINGSSFDSTTLLSSATLFHHPSLSSIRLTAYKQLWLSGWLVKAVGSSTCHRLGRSLLTLSYHLTALDNQSSTDTHTSTDTVRVSLSPVMAQLGHQLLQLAFMIGIPQHQFLQCLTGTNTDTDIDMLDDAEDSTLSVSLPSSSSFYHAYRSLIDSYLLQHFAQYSQSLLTAALSSNSDLLTQMINIGEFALERRMRKQRGLRLLEKNQFTIDTNTNTGTDTSSANDAERQSSAYVDSLLTNFATIFTLSRKSKTLDFPVDSSLALSLLRLMAVINDVDRSKFLSPNASLQEFGDIYLQCLSLNANFTVKNTALKLLPLFLDDEYRPSIDWKQSPSFSNIRTAILTRIARLIHEPPFPTRSTDLTVGSSLYKDFTALFDSLLVAIKESRAFDLVKSLLPLLRERNSLYRDTINRSMLAYVSSVNEAGKAQQSLALSEAAYQLFCDRELDLLPVDNARAFVMRAVVLPMLKQSPVSTVKSFFANHYTALWSRIETFDTTILTNASTDSDEIDLTLLELSLLYDTIAVMFHRLSVEEYTSIGANHKSVMKIAHSHVKKLQGNDRESLTAFRVSAWAALVAALCRSQNDSKWFDLLAFDVKAAKNEILWPNILDLNTRWLFEIDTNFKTLGLESLNQLNASTGSGVDQSLMIGNKSAMTSRLGRWLDSSQLDSASQDAEGMSRYLTSQYLNDSSLSHDANGLFASERFPNTDASSDSGTGSGSPLSSTNTSASVSTMTVDLDSIMSQSAMPTLLSLIDHLESKFRTEYLASPNMPPWLQSMFDRLSTTDANNPTHVNIKWTIVKVVTLRWTFVERWAGQWWQAIVKFLMLGEEATGGNGFHYMLRDCCVTFLRWNVRPRPDNNIERALASDFVAHLMKVAIDHGKLTTGKKSKLTSNLQLIRIFIERWKNLITIQRSIIVKHCQQPLGTGQRGASGHGITVRLTGLQLMAMLLHYHFPIYDNSDHSTSDADIKDALLNNLRSERKSLYEPAAEVYGLILAANARESVSREKKDFWYSPFREHIKTFFQQQKHAMLLDILIKVGINTHDIDLFDTEFVQRLFTLPFFHSQLMQSLLQLVLWASVKAQNVFDLFYTSGWIERILDNNDRRCKELLLLITLKRINEITLAQFQSLLPRLHNAFIVSASGSDETCRALFYKLCLALLNNQSTAVARHRQQHPSDPFIHSVQSYLAHGLNDNASVIRESIIKFLDSSSQLSNDLPLRFVQILTLLTDPSLSQSWLQSVMSLLLYPIQNSSDYDRRISDVPLEQTKFTIYEIDSEAFTKSATFTPLFASHSQSNDTFADDDSDVSVDDSDSDAMDTDSKSNTSTDMKFHTGVKSEQLNRKPVAVRPRHLIAATQTPMFPSTLQILTLDANQLIDYDLSQQSQSEYLYYRPTRSNANSDASVGSLADYQLTPQQRLAKRRLKRGNNRGSVKQQSRYTGRVEVGEDVLQMRFRGFLQSSLSQPSSQSHSQSFASKDSSQHFAKLADTKNRYTRAWEQRQRVERSHRVSLFRAYRIGELPDIQILHRDLLSPLLALTNEPSLAHTLFNVIVPPLFEQAGLWFNDSAVDRATALKEFHSRASELMLRTLLGWNTLTHSQATETSTAVNAIHSALITASSTISYDIFTPLTSTQLPPIADLSVKSNNIHTGIRLLEVGLINTYRRQSQSKTSTKSKTVDDGDGVAVVHLKNEEMFNFQLARLYHCLGDNDVTLNLYQRSSHHPLTWQALHASLLGDANQAFELYDRALEAQAQAAEMRDDGKPVSEIVQVWRDIANTVSGGQSSPTRSLSRHESVSTESQSSLVPSRVEATLWASERLESLRALSDWGSLRSNVMLEVDGDLRKLFFDENREPTDFLDHFLSSSLKRAEELAIEGDGSGDASACVSMDDSGDESKSITSIKAQLEHFLTDANRSTDRTALLDANYAHHLLRFYCLNVSNRFTLANHYLSLSYDSFVRSWSRMPLLASHSRLKALEQLQQITDMNQFLQCQSVTGPTTGTSRTMDANESFHHSVSVVRRQFQNWSLRLPSSQSLTHSAQWDDLATHKPTFMLQLYQSLEVQCDALSEQPFHSERQSLLDTLHSDLTYILAHFLVKSSLSQAHANNFTVSNKYLSRAGKFHYRHRSSVPIIDQSIELSRFYTKIKLMVLQTRYQRDQIVRNNTHTPAHTDNDSHARMIETLTKCWAQVDDQQSRTSTNYQAIPALIAHYRFLRLKASINEELFALHSGKANDRAASQNVSEAEQNHSKLSKLFVEQLATFDTNISNDSVTPVSAVKLEMSSSSVILRKAAKSFLAAAKFANSRLLFFDEADAGIFTRTRSTTSTNTSKRTAKLSSSEESHLISMLITNVLHGMRLNDREARALFPRALELLPRLSDDSECRHQFQAMTSGRCDQYGTKVHVSDCRCHTHLDTSADSDRRIPLWMFLQWLPQLLSQMGSNSYHLVAPIIEQLAVKYPQAVFFPFHLSSTTVNTDARLDSKNKQVLTQSTNKLKALLTSKLLPRLIQAFDSLTFPDHKSKDMWNEVKNLLGRKESGAAVKVWQSFRDSMLAPSTSSHTHDRKLSGAIAAKFAGRFKKKFDDILATELSDVSKAALININAMNRKMTVLLDEISRDREVGSKSHSGNMALKLFSPWLVDYRQHALQAKEVIELPGQYTGLVEPLTDRHIMLESFHPTVLVLASLRKPKKLTMLGSDELEHSYLIKGGEDMRLDQRIEQLFATLNDIIHTDTNTHNDSKASFRLRTYAALPLTPRLGCVEWMPNTTTVKSLINEISNSGEFTTEAMQNYVSLLKDLSKHTPPLESSALTVDVIEHASHSRVVSKYEALVSKTNTENLIVKYLQSLTANVEAFLTVRQRFAHSFAVLTAACYILGIGDRHLDNFLFDRGNGELIAIDFGAAFGQGVLLAVPELMTVRLTPQLKTLLSPLPTVNLLRTDLVALLTAFHQQSSLLMTIMAVFVNEPHIEWNEAAKQKNKARAKRTDSESADSESAGAGNDVQWLPRRKLAIAKSKLNAVNPARVMIEELNDNSSVMSRPALKKACDAVALGADRASHRATVGEWCASIEEQVDCILEQATDPNVLGRTWQGWLPNV